MISFLSPNHGIKCGLIGQTRGDQIGIVSALVQGHHDRGGRDIHFAGQIQQIAEDGFGLGVAVFPTDALAPSCGTENGHERQLHVEIHFHPDHAGERVDMEELDGLGDSVFDEHALRVARHQFDGPSLRWLVNRMVGSSCPSSITVNWRSSPS